MPELSSTGPFYLRDWQHASKLFVANHFRLLPKYSFLFHIFVNLNDNAINTDFISKDNKTEIGLLAKSVDLPKFTVETKTFNAYNRPNYVQNKIKYDPVTIVFHDDSDDVVRRFWYDYYAFYYRDADQAPSVYMADHKYKKRQTDNWGFTPYSTDRFIKSIEIYSLHQKQYSAYLLYNPIITRWQHAKQDRSEPNAMLDNTMEINYEAVHYAAGNIIDEDVTGFGEMPWYDQTESWMKGKSIGTTAADAAGKPRQNYNESTAIQTTNVDMRNLYQNPDTVLASDVSKSINSVTTSTFKYVVPSVVPDEGISASTANIRKLVIDV